MPWKINIGEESISIDKLSIDDLSSVCGSRTSDGIQKYPYLNWMQLRNSPATEPEAFYDLVCAVARRVGTVVPDRPQNVGEMIAFVNEHVGFDSDDDLPTEFGEGGIPLEEAEKQETTTSSTSTAPEAGTPTEPEELP